MLDIPKGLPPDPIERAEAAERRLEFLAKVSAMLGASLDYETTLADLARLAVPFLADWCIVYLAETDIEEGPVRRVAVSYANPANAALALDLQSSSAPDPGSRHPAVDAVRNGQPVLLPVMTDALLQAIATDERHLEVLRRMNLRSSMCMPLKVQGRLVGCLLFLTSDSGRIYGEEDLQLAEDLASRAALAVENTRLYREAQQARITGERLNERLQNAMIETHHRVKNNLQIIAAMIDSRLMEEHNPVSEADLRRLASNVRALSSVHDALTHRARETGEADIVTARAVLGRLLPLIQQTSPGHVITVEVEDVPLTDRQGTSLALIVNELVNNALKHGRSSVYVVMAASGNSCTMRVEDDGDGFPVGFDSMRSANTGLTLVETLSRWDLAGKVEYLNRAEGGACVKVSFPLSS
jgi:two-component sensor histidine kinase